MSSFGILFVRRKRLFLSTFPSNRLLRAAGVVGCFWSNSTTPAARRPPGPCQGPARPFIELRAMFFTQCLPNVLLWRTCGRLVEDLHCSSLMIFVMSHSLQSVCPANFKKESDYFLFSKEKIKELILLKWSEIRKLSARQDLLWSSFLTMSFFSKRGKKTC